MESVSESMQYYKQALDPKRCFMPRCNNTSVKTPEKLFLSVPKSIKPDLYRAVGIEKVPLRNVHICEDHLDLEEDIENYNAWILNNGQPKLKKRIPQSLILSGHSVDLGPSSAPQMLTFIHKSKSVEAKPEVLNKHVQVQVRMQDKSTTCSFKVPEKAQFVETVTLSEEDEFLPSIKGSTSDMTLTEIDSTSGSGLSLPCPLVGRSFLVDLIMKKPLAYIGIPRKCVWLIDDLANECKNISALGIIMTLYKIKNNETFPKIADLFQVSRTTQWKTFFKTLQVLSMFLKQFIFWPTAIHIKQNLPTTFKTNVEYANVHSIIDCFEIEIEKPSDPVEQSKTWSQYKSCNTLKYLISATPDGFVNFISPGYGGRISDVMLVEKCGFLDIIPPGCTILADRGFKHLEAILAQKSVKLLRPPTVTKGSKMSKSDVITTKIIASLRIHIERVIRRLRVFKFLKPHAVINNKLINCTDNVVQVVCGLMNMQSPIIKSL